MAPYSKKTPSILRSIFESQLFQMGLLVAIGAMGWQVYDRYTVERTTADRRMHAEAEYDQLLEQRDHLAEQVENLYDDFGIESEIRRNFDVARDGEEIVVIVENDFRSVPARPGPVVPDRSQTKPEVIRWYEFWR